jgi:hypothetical protein
VLAPEAPPGTEGPSASPSVTAPGDGASGALEPPGQSVAEREAGGGAPPAEAPPAGRPQAKAPYYPPYGWGRQPYYYPYSPSQGR